MSPITCMNCGRALRPGDPLCCPRPITEDGSQNAMPELIVCGNGCGHNHESPNGPTGCCAKHGPYMYFCPECHEERGPSDV